MNPASRLPASALSDSDLMLLIAQGFIEEPAAELFERHNDALFNFIAWLCQGDVAQAEDICQKVWLKLLQYSGEYQPRAAFRTFLFQIARNTLIDEKRGAYEKHKETLNEETLEIPDDDLTPEEETLIQQNQLLLRDALMKLPAPQREVVVLRFISELSMNEIAETIGCGFETVKSRLRYAFAKLRHELGQTS
jgi:RNA polymerase sigma-70 factor (ECF subfamily)